MEVYSKQINGRFNYLQSEESSSSEESILRVTEIEETVTFKCTQTVVGTLNNTTGGYHIKPVITRTNFINI